MSTFAAYVVLCFMQDRLHHISPEKIEDGIDIIRSFQSLMLITFIIVAIADLIVLISTAFLMLRISRRLESFEHIKYKKEKKWFLIVLKICTLLLFTWPFELHQLMTQYDKVYLLTSDIIKLYSAMVLFGILIFQNEARLLICRKYNLVDLFK